MIDKSIIRELESRQGKLNFDGLIYHMKVLGFTFRDRELRGPIGLAGLDCIYLNVNMLKHYSDRFVYFAVLHEIAHLKRINKLGETKILESLSDENFKCFMSHLILEEVIADRYACYVYYRLNREVYPWNCTQQLNLLHKQENYEEIGKLYFGQIENSREKYNELMKKFIKE